MSTISVCLSSIKSSQYCKLCVAGTSQRYSRQPWIKVRQLSQWQVKAGLVCHRKVWKAKLYTINGTMWHLSSQLAKAILSFVPQLQDNHALCDFVSLSAPCRIAFAVKSIFPCNGVCVCVHVLYSKNNGPSWNSASLLLSVQVIFIWVSHIDSFAHCFKKL